MFFVFSKIPTCIVHFRGLEMEDKFGPKRVCNYPKKLDTDSNCRQELKPL